MNFELPRRRTATRRDAIDGRRPRHATWRLRVEQLHRLLYRSFELRVATSDDVGRRDLNFDVGCDAFVFHPSYGVSYVAPMALLNMVVVAVAATRKARTSKLLKAADAEQRKGFRWYVDDNLSSSEPPKQPRRARR